LLSKLSSAHFYPNFIGHSRIPAIHFEQCHSQQSAFDLV
jgi:hypothetical protein